VFSQAELKRQEEERISREEKQKKRREALAKARREELERVQKEVDATAGDQQAEAKGIALALKENGELETVSCVSRVSPNTLVIIVLVFFSIYFQVEQMERL
jgi:hypothetical protein